MPATQTKAPRSPAAVPITPVRPVPDGIDALLSHVSHELRTPLSAIVLWTKLLDELGNSDPAQLKEAVTAIRSSADELQHLIDDLVDMSRVLTGRVRVEPQPTNLEHAVDEAMNSVRPLAEEDQVVLLARHEVDELTAHADPMRFVQILRNLLRHAIGVSPAGSKVTITTRSSSGAVEIAISDSGPGLPPQLETHIFDPLGLSPPQNGNLGNSIALAVARQLVDLHVGRIRAHSGPGPGTTFTVWLPGSPSGQRVANGDDDPLDGLPVETSAPLQGKRVLLVEDSADTRRALTLILAGAGAEVVEAASSSAALKAFQRGGFDLVVSDLGLPKMDGYQMMKQFRRWEELDAKPPVPAVALTAFAGEGTRRRALQSGFHGCLNKPVEPARLISALSGLLRQRRVTAAA